MLYTLGYQKRTAEEFYGIIAAHNIGHVLDVRSKPNGRRPEFNPKRMAAEVPKYTWLGKTCGGFGVVTDQAIADLAETIRASESAGENTVLVCFERDHTECHRYYDLARRLEPLGITAHHL